jgi:hypothetical protein
MIWVLAVAGVTGAVVVAFAIWLWLSAKTLRCRGGEIYYGSGGEIYYGSPVTADEARRLGEYLERRDFFKPTQPAVGLGKKTGTYQFSLPAAEEQYQDEEVLVKCAGIAAALSEEVFTGAPVEVHLCDGRWRTRTVVPHCGKFGKRFSFNAAELFVTTGVTEDQAIRLGTYLMNKRFFNDNPKLGQLNRTADGFELRLQVKNESDPGSRKDFQRMARDLSQDVFGGVPVEVCSCEGVRKTLHQQVSDLPNDKSV